MLFCCCKTDVQNFYFLREFALLYFDWFLKNFDLCNMFDIEKNWKQLLEIGWQRKKKRKLKPTSFLWFISRTNPFILNKIVEFYDPKDYLFLYYEKNSKEKQGFFRFDRKWQWTWTCRVKQQFP